MVKLLRKIGLSILGIVVFWPAILILGLLIYRFLPEFWYEWVYIKANGKIERGTIYKNDSWWSKDYPWDNGLPEDGLLITGGSSYKYNKSCSRTYKLKGARLRIDHGNDDLTEGIQITYQADGKLIAWGSTKQLHHYKESVVDGIRVAHVYQWIPDLARYHEQLYRIDEDICSSGFCSLNTSRDKLYSGWWSWDDRDRIPLSKKRTEEMDAIVRYEKGKVVEEFWYHPDQKANPVESVQKEKELFAKQGKTEFAAIRKKFKDGLNIKDDKLETCSYWFK